MSIAMEGSPASINEIAISIPVKWHFHPSVYNIIVWPQLVHISTYTYVYKDLHHL